MSNKQPYKRRLEKCQNSTEITKITFIIGSIRTGTGGFASVWQMAEELAQSGYDVHLLVMCLDPHFKYHMHRLKNRQGELHGITIHYIPGFREFLKAKGHSSILHSIRNVIRCLYHPNKDTLKAFLESVFVFFNSKDVVIAKSTLTNSTIVIKSIPLSGRELAALRNITEACVILNHSNSPQATYNNDLMILLLAISY